MIKAMWDDLSLKMSKIKVCCIYSWDHMIKAMWEDI